MLIQRPAAARGRGSAPAEGLDSRHTFSSGTYYDPEWTGFGVLRVVNEHRVAPGAGLPLHRHANMEVLSYVLSGTLAHRDGAGVERLVRAGGLQWLGAGHGVEHRDYNPSADHPLHFLQVWLQPDRVNAPPARADRAPTPGPGWQLLASSDGAAGSLAVRQDVRLYRLALEPNREAAFDLDPGRSYWLHVATGAVGSGEQALAAGDGLGILGEEGALVLAGRADGPGEVLLFELPPQAGC